MKLQFYHMKIVVINPEQSKCLFEESKFSFDNLIDECINNIETITITNKEKNELL